ncbi:Aspartyl/glutamyl-tRNA(Asn/Gln) amidotransferase subunit C [Candidatus Portiera aleyrodidarum]|uniref:Aspartyl/glutamyl-tRNA(Asn/Gln) amidotransferase subunit C n=1 Tax=Candidatus Portiera aleyrodidarum TaxID=91844 RepID=A0A6S6S616_9GAMM|nr:hypothetical protein [Candidatus Portiera aleyrodidarum]CAA3707304.1 Aspartyl/glutamyl-tRNA(Asn/Gln) amidotransferase subunit C [Candidatus Portiera aleyrodidarum]
MNFNKQILSKLSKINKHDINLNTLKININLLLNNIFVFVLSFYYLKNIKPITNPLNNIYLLNIRKDKIQTNKKIKTYIGSAPKKTNYYIILPNIL